MDDDLRSFGENLITTAARIVRWVPKDDDIDLSIAAARLLARLNDNGPTRISDLALAERCSQPTITNHVKRLEAADMVTRTVDPSDGRAWMISISDEGQRQLALMRSSLSRAIEPYLARLSRRDLKALHEGVDVMNRLMALDRLPQ
jgi:DNA-binding MarR family transcriptional regulator